MPKSKSCRKKPPKRVLALPDLEHAKTAVLNSLTSASIHVATVAAISAGAVSPNWSYHTNPVTAFLLTIFNARLGWWLLNRNSSPYPVDRV